MQFLWQFLVLFLMYRQSQNDYNKNGTFKGLTLLFPARYTTGFGSINCIRNCTSGCMKFSMCASIFNYKVKEIVKSPQSLFVTTVPYKNKLIPGFPAVGTANDQL